MSAPLDVWAPSVARVDVIAEGRRVAMRAAADGWHHLDASLPPGTLYTLSLDGSAPLPDPRSRAQPLGPHGASQIVDVASLARGREAFAARPLRDAVIYELHVGTFTDAGTLDGAIERLDHVASLGVTHVELMPLADFPGARGWGYDGVGLFAVHAPFGGVEALERVARAAHARGLAVILDIVVNHLGPSGNYLARFAPFFREDVDTPWGSAPRFTLPGVRRFFLDCALYFLRDLALDGLRLDAADLILDESTPHFLAELADEVRALERETGRRIALIAETDANDPRFVLERARGGHGLDAQWSDDLHRALHAWLTGERHGWYADFGALDHVATALRHAYVLRGGPSRFRGGPHGTSHGGLPAERFLGYAQSHDQVGNRPGGERLAHLVGVARAKLAAALVLAGPFPPMLFAGEEWAASTPFHYFHDHAESALRRSIREGREREQRAFGWPPSGRAIDPASVEAFEASRLAWGELEARPHADMLAWTRALLALRASRADLRASDLASVEVEHDASGWLVMRRARTGVAVHDGRDAVRVAALDAGDVLAACGGARVEGGALVMPPASSLIFARAP